MATIPAYKQEQLRAKGRLRYLRGGKILWSGGTLDLGIQRFKRTGRGDFFNRQYKLNGWTPENLERVKKVKVKGKEK